MADLVMLDLPAGPDFVTALQRVWEQGDAAFPLDQRLPASERAMVTGILAPTAVIEADLTRRALSGGRPVESGDALALATSGTSGVPKGVILTHDAVQASSTATSTAIGVDPTSDRWLCCLPVAHVGGLSIITRALHTGTSLDVHPTFQAQAVTLAARAGATLVSLVTRALNQIDTTLWRRIVIGGAAPPPDRAANVLATWGMTETGSGCVYDGYPIANTELRTTAEGELEVRGPMLLRAYRTSERDTDPKSADGWLRTGDLATLDSRGRLFVEGRRGDVINTGAEKVWPDRVEQLITTHRGVADVAVVGRPDPEWGQRVVAVIVAADRASLPQLSELRDLVKSQLGTWHAPTSIEFVERLPRTAIGKLKRGELR